MERASDQHDGPRSTASRRTAGSRRAARAGAEWDILATALNRWGILHVAPRHRRRAGVPRTAHELFERLWSATEPRLQQSAVLLLLTHPRLADEAMAAIARLSGVERDRAMRRYVAAAALQRMARTRIELSLGPRPAIPPAYLAELDLPSLDEEFGRASLWAMAEHEQERYGYDAWHTYLGLLDLFFTEIRRRDWGVTCDSGPIKRA